MTNEETVRQETITALKKMSDKLYEDQYLYYSEVCDDAINIIEKLIAENERLKQTNEEWNQYIPFLYAHGFFHEEVEE